MEELLNSILNATRSEFEGSGWGDCEWSPWGACIIPIENCSGSSGKGSGMQFRTKQYVGSDNGGDCDGDSIQSCRGKCKDKILSSRFYLDQNQYIDIGIYIGAAGGFLLILVIATLLILIRKRRAENNNIASDNIELPVMSNGNSSTARTKNFEPIPIRDFFKGIVSLERQQEYEKLNDDDQKRASGQVIHATMKKNQRKNRDKQIVAYDNHRVKVNVSPSETDYINATWMRRPSMERDYDCAILNQYLPLSMMTFIVTQNPTNETVHSYLHMLRHNSIDFVLAFSDEFKGKDEHLGSVSKKVLNKKKINDYMAIEVWEVTTIKQGFYGGRDSHCLRFLCLNGLGLETNISDEKIKKLLTAITQIRKEIGTNRDSVNIVLQDDYSGSSGAAVFLALLEMLESIDDAITKPNIEPNRIKGEINVFNVVSELRRKRAKMIMNYEQYQLLFKALVFYSKHKNEFDAILKDKRRTRTSSEPNHEDEDTVSYGSVIEDPSTSNIHEDEEDSEIFREDSVP